MRRDEPKASCRRVQGRLERLVDGALAPIDAARDRGHLEACAACGRAVADHEHLLEGIRALAVRDGELGERASEPIEAFVLSASARAGRPDLRRRELVRWAPVAAAAAALLVLRLVLGGAPIAPRAEGFASLDPLLARLPDWADVLHGLGHWVQRIVA